MTSTESVHTFNFVDYIFLKEQDEVSHYYDGVTWQDDSLFKWLLEIFIIFIIIGKLLVTHSSCANTTDPFHLMVHA